MSYQVIYRDVSDGVFVPLRQTGYASIHIRRTATARSSRLPLNYTRKSGSTAHLGLAEHKSESNAIVSDTEALIRTIG
jgi:hypothetical protein